MVWNPPKVDPEGHKLEPPNVRAGWSACDCAKATGGTKGHQYVECLICGWEWREGGCDVLVDGRRPQRRGGTGNPGDPGYPAR